MSFEKADRERRAKPGEITFQYYGKENVTGLKDIEADLYGAIGVSGKCAKEFTESSEFEGWKNQLDKCLDEKGHELQKLADKWVKAQEK